MSNKKQQITIKSVECDSIRKYDVKEIESERRNGYARYGTWPEKLLKTEYPEWVKNNLK